MKSRLVFFASGLVFAFGLALSGMTRPEKVLGFLNVSGDWDPSLMFVMVGAIGVHMFFARRALRMRAPLMASAFAWPDRTRVDARLILGAAIFGVGWGLGGFCPGPALASLPSGMPKALGFTAAMAIGIAGVSWMTRPARAVAPPRSPAVHDPVDHLADES
jgi:uncharacterized membrane protein YedE/YeeE